MTPDAIELVAALLEGVKAKGAAASEQMRYYEAITAELPRLIREARAAARMREALKPFAERAKLTDETYYPPMAGTQYISVTLDECRIAAATLEESTP